MFSSCSPISALVDGVNTGSGRRSDSWRPAGISVPCIVPSAWYSFHADPVMYPRTMHSIGNMSALRVSIVATRQLRITGAVGEVGEVGGDAGGCGATSASRSNQNADMAVSTRPLSGMVSSITTSKAEIRSEVTIRRRSWPSVSAPAS